MPSYIEEPQEPLSSSLLDDVFGDAAFPCDHNSAPLSAHPSDMPSLQALHHTSGYREGFTEAKSTSIQAGFDEGFSLGGSIGLRVGYILGILEGIAEATQDSQMLSHAQAELTAEMIFSSGHWAPDGTWSFAVSLRGEKPEEEDGEVVFADVAEAHPLVRKWKGLVDEQVEMSGLDLHVLEATAARRLTADTISEQDKEGDAAVEAPRPAKAKQAGKKGSLDW